MEKQKKTQQINRPLEYGCVKVLRGKDQIGGSVVQISVNDTRIWVDFGSELSVPASKSTDSELVKLMHDKETRPSAVFFTHIHGDHIGLLSEIEDDVDIYIGELGKKMKDNVINALTKPAWREETEKEKIQREKLQREQYLLNREEPKTCFYKNGESQKYNEEIEFEALRVDHSVYDSYMLKFKVKVMENGKETTKVILHTGDFRGHGRLGENLIENLKQFINNQEIDILITEGTMMSRATEKVMTEVDMQKKAKEILEREENKYAFLICSSTNLDSLSSFYRAAVNSKNNRALYCSEYIKSQLELFTKEIGEKENRWEYKFYRSYEFDKQLKLELKNGQKQEQYMCDNGFLLIVNQYDEAIIEYFKKLNPLLIYSMWDGYLDAEKPYANKNLINIVNKMGKRVEKLHTSGHATPSLIAKVINTVKPREAIIPIHTERAGGFYMLDIPNERKNLIISDIPIDENFEYEFCPEDDNRALVGNKADMFEQLKPGGKLHAFVELVSDSKNNLELCFRGNSGKTCTIYYNNNEFFKISWVKKQPRLSFNMQHARYYKDISQLEKKLSKYGLKWHETKNVKEYVSTGKVYTKAELEDLYKVRLQIMESYFSTELEYCEDQYIQGKTVQPGSKLKLEKIEQQKLMTANSNCHNGYFIYDMEFAQPFKNQPIKDVYAAIVGEKKQNKPDSLAIKFVDNKPANLVFVELKSTSAAMKGKSGAIAHILGMDEYISNPLNKQFIENRINEAYDIMDSYKKLGLRNCDVDLNRDDFMKLKDREIEKLLVITDNVPEGIFDKDGNKVQSAYSYLNNCRKDVKSKIIEARNKTKCKILLLKNNEFDLFEAEELP